MFQTKVRCLPEEQLGEMELGNLPEREVRAMVVKMTQDLRKEKEACLRGYKKY